MLDTSWLIYAFHNKPSLKAALILGLVIGCSLVWPIYYYGTGRAADVAYAKRHTLPPKGEVKNKYGFDCLYLGVSTDTGQKYYYIPSHVPSLYDSPQEQQYYCSEQQARDAGYQPSQ